MFCGVHEVSRPEAQEYPNWVELTHVRANNSCHVDMHKVRRPPGSRIWHCVYLVREQLHITRSPSNTVDVINMVPPSDRQDSRAKLTCATAASAARSDRDLWVTAAVLRHARGRP